MIIFVLIQVEIIGTFLINFTYINKEQNIIKDFYWSSIMSAVLYLVVALFGFVFALLSISGLKNK